MQGLDARPFCAAGDLTAAYKLRVQLFEQSSEAGCLQCLPPPLAQFAAWVLDTAHSPTVDLEEVRTWHGVLLKAVGLGTQRYAWMLCRLRWLGCGWLSDSTDVCPVVEALATTVAILLRIVASPKNRFLWLHLPSHWGQAEVGCIAGRTQMLCRERWTSAPALWRLVSLLTCK